MEDESQNRIPSLQLQPPTVDFIDNRLPDYHPLFKDPPVHYDTTTRQYVPNAIQSPVPRSHAVQQHQNFPYHTNTLSHQASPSGTGNVVYDATGGGARPTWTDVKSMHLLNQLLPKALAHFKMATPEPTDQANSTYSIRSLSDWDAIHKKLLESQSAYQEGRFAKARRRVADKVRPVAGGSRSFTAVVPDTLVSTPIVGIIQVVLEATSAAATVRAEATQGFDNLTDQFSEVEFFLGTFPDDRRIQNASLDLIVVILQAVERAIGFFISNGALRAVKALGMGDQYESKLVHSLEEIRTKSQRLVHEAQISNIHASHTFSRDTRQVGQHILNGQASLAAGLAKLEDLALGEARTFNFLESFLADHIQQRNHWLAAEETYKKSIASLESENDMLRSASPNFQNLISASPSLRFSRELLWDLTGASDVDLIDIASVLDKAERLPWRQRVQVEQVVQTQHFRNWITSPVSTRLLIHWDRNLPRKIDHVSPLSTFLASLTRMFRQNGTHFVAAVWFCAEHLDISGIGSSFDGSAMLASLIDQILRQQCFDLHNSPLETGEVSMDALQAGDFNALFAVLEWLVSQLPGTITLVFLIDSVASYEEDRETRQVLAFLLRLAGAQHLRAAVKVLFASTPGTNFVRMAFEEEDLIVNIDVLPQMVWAPSDERLGRELSNVVAE